MIRSLVERISQELSGERAKQSVAAIIQHHRIQASPGYRRAAEYVAARLREYGVPNSIRQFPADGRKFYWTYQSFPAWEVRSATLDLIDPEPRRLCDFATCPTSLIQRSAPCKPVNAELVVLEDGTEPEEYKGRNLKGKIVLTKGDSRRVFQLAVGEHGALGLVTDIIWDAKPIRGRYDLPDARQYLGVFGDTDGLKSFGFVISVKEGERLRALVKEQAKKGRKVKVRAEVNTRLYAGAFDVVDAFIPGRTKEEVLLVAHLCHAQPSANDNASGSACLLEVARTLRRMIAEKKLPKPVRGMRFLWVPEFSGTYAYLATYPETMKRAIAGLNLDMVGQNQDLCGSSMLIEAPPLATPSYTAELLRRIRDEIIPEAPTHSGLGGYALFRYADTPYSGGSDHAILSDPTVGIPSPMIIQWPDRYYHTSEDTLDKVDPKSLKRVGTMAAAYAWFLADCGKRGAKWLAEEVVAQMQIELVRNCRVKLTEFAGAEGIDIPAICRFETRLEMWLEQKLKAIDAVKRLARIGPELDILKNDLRETFEREMRKFAIACPYDRRDPNLEGPRSRWEREAARLVPVRLYVGPVQLRGALRKVSRDEREWLYQFMKKDSQGLGLRFDLALFWSDGKRNLLEIADLVEAETGKCEVEAFVTYFRFLKRLKLISLSEE
jgi:aminopeptidase-like protein